MKQLIVIGNGPAGVSAAIYAKRSGVNVTVIGNGLGSLEKAAVIENYYGFEEPISGFQLVISGINQAKRLGVDFIDGEVIGLAFEETLLVKTTETIIAADAVILATGNSRKIPKISGFDTFEGKGISYCAVCDGFFYKGKDVAVLGSSDYAIAEASELLPLANSVTILTNGEQPKSDYTDSFEFITQKISSLSGENTLDTVSFADGASLKISGLFIALGVAGSQDLARKLGAVVEGNLIVIDENMATNIPGLYAAGDCTGGMLQIAKAVYEGAKAGSEAAKFILNM